MFVVTQLLKLTEQIGMFVVEAPAARMPGSVMLMLVHGNASPITRSSAMVTFSTSASPVLCTTTYQVMFVAMMLLAQLPLKFASGVLPLTDTSFSQVMIAGFTWATAEALAEMAPLAFAPGQPT